MKPPSAFWLCLTYSTVRSMVSRGTAIPTFRAARRAITWQIVTERSASCRWGKYLHPPSSFCVLTISRTALRSLSRSSGCLDIPWHSARNSVANPWPYIGPWLAEAGWVIKPLPCVWANR
jgi:hypothetical protein